MTDKDELNEVKKELYRQGLLNEFVLKQEKQSINNDLYTEALQNYSEDEIIAFCSDDYTEGDVLMWLAKGINYDLICDCIAKHEIWD